MSPRLNRFSWSANLEPARRIWLQVFVSRPVGSAAACALSQLRRLSTSWWRRPGIASRLGVTFRFDIANPDLEMPLAVLTAPNECRIQGHSDRRYRHVRPRSGLISQHRADFQSVMAQGLGVISGVNRKHLL